VRLWKLLGLAGLAGVAATGAVLARGERQRRATTPEEVRARLRERHATLAEVHDPADAAATDPATDPAEDLATGHRRRLARLLRRR
jgi:hypothetical protein